MAARKPKITALSVLTEARALLAKPYTWTKGTYKGAVVRKGNHVVTYCSVGALRESSMKMATAREYPINKNAYESAHNILRECIGGDVVKFNDAKTTKKRDVLAAFDCAIAKAEARDDA